MSYLLTPYDDALRLILKKGIRRKNRTGVDTLRVLSIRSEYDIETYFPLVTKRKLYPKAVFAELLWMLSGSTNNDDLVKLGCHYWTPWADPTNEENAAFYKRTGFPVGYFGPTYGWQMRHFGGDYQNHFGFPVGHPHVEWGFDQVSYLINEIKANPSSRRIVMNLWNPADISISRLPPCLYYIHVDIDDEGRMTVLTNQRSADEFVGVPANIQFYSAFCYMLAQQTGYKPYRFIHHTEDTHIYVNQLSAVEEYLSRPEIPSPRLHIKQAKDMFSYAPDDFEIIGYNPLPSIKVPVVV